MQLLKTKKTEQKQFGSNKNRISNPKFDSYPKMAWIVCAIADLQSISSVEKSKAIL